MSSERRGRVTSFTSTRGLGEIMTNDGERFPFHATQIAGGIRRIAVEDSVVFEIVPGPNGYWEASNIRAED